jgi:hypothetical protein
MANTTFDFQRVWENLANGTLTEFPIDEYLQNIIDCVRQYTIITQQRDFVLHKLTGYQGGPQSTNPIIVYECKTKPGRFSLGYTPGDYTITGTAQFKDIFTGDSHWGYNHSGYRLDINIGVGRGTGFTNPDFQRFHYNVQWLEIRDDVDTKPARCI